MGFFPPKTNLSEIIAMAQRFKKIEREFYSHDAHAMELWQLVEMYYYYVFVEVIRCEDREISTIIYNEI